ncbi:TSUP family transporter, partial [Streptomyces sp. NPDC059455]|uniref:TSUP family transporter n=1 Tax=Streptomyces sp. NPDC059455 TaxID=3346837 RepID=UPI0036B4C5E1
LVSARSAAWAAPAAAPPARAAAGPPAPPRLKAGSYGVLGGFTTMVANAGGPVMSLYLLSAGFRKLGFLGTSAWFFLIVNVAKVPFSVSLGLIDGRSLLLDALLALFVLPGAYIGKACVDRINQKLFERLVIAATVLGGLQLLLR